MTASDTVHDAVQDAQSQIAALRKQVNQLMNDRVTPKLADAAEKAQATARQPANTPRTRRRSSPRRCAAAR